jgi:hypothetical protein
MKKLVLFSLVAVVLAGCPGIQKKDDKEKLLIEDIDKVLADLPNPTAVPYQLRLLDGVFSDELLNPLENLEKYLGDEDKLAMAMGVYASDVSLLAAFGDKERSLEYVKACHRIGEILGDSSVFPADLLSRIEQSMDDDDKLSALMREMIVQTSIQLENDHHLTMAAMALVGSFIEELYQAVNVIEHYHDQNLTKEEEKRKIEPLVKLVLDQEPALADLIKLVEDIPHDMTILQLLEKLRILDRLYKGELEVIEQNMANDPDYIIDRGVMLAATLEIERIRAFIVE